MLSLFGLGFLLGVQNALEAFHFGAVVCSPLATRHDSVLVHFITRVIGHTATLLLLGVTVLFLVSN